MKSGRKLQAVITCAAVACATLGTLAQSAHAGTCTFTGTAYFNNPAATQAKIAEVTGPGEDNQQPAGVTGTSHQVATFQEDYPNEPVHGFLAHHNFSYSFVATRMIWTGSGEGHAKSWLDGINRDFNWTVTYFSNSGTPTGTNQSGSSWDWGSVNPGANTSVDVTFDTFIATSHAKAKVAAGLTGASKIKSETTWTTTSFGIPSP